MYPLVLYYVNWNYWHNGIVYYNLTLQIERKLPSESSEDWKFVRIAHLDSGGNAVKIGLYCCSPTEEGMSVVFDKLSIQPSDGTYNHTYWALIFMIVASGRSLKFQVAGYHKLLLIKPWALQICRGFKEAYKQRRLYPRGVITGTEKALWNEL